MRLYRTTLLVCTLVWFLIGMHVPTIHQITHHGGGLSMTVAAAVTTLAAIGLLSLWALMRAPKQVQHR